MESGLHKISGVGFSLKNVTKNLGDLQDYVDQLQNEIDFIKSEIQTINQYIQTITSDIQTIEGNVTINQQDISNLDLRVTQNETDIDKNKKDIVNVQNDTTINGARITSNELDLGSFSNDLDVTKGRVTNNETSITDIYNILSGLQTPLQRVEYDTGYNVVSPEMIMVYNHNLNVDPPHLIINYYIQIVSPNTVLFNQGDVIQLNSGVYPLAEAVGIVSGIQSYWRIGEDEKNTIRFATQLRALYAADGTGSSDRQLDWSDVKLRIVIAAYV